jgi:predicted secreted protein
MTRLRPRRRRRLPRRRNSRMSAPFAIAIFFTIWWVVLFAVLPFGTQSYAETGAERPQGTEAGAPLAPRMGLKLIITTIVSAIVFAGVYGLIIYES